MNYTLNYAEKWGLHELTDKLNDKDGCNILTKIDVSKFGILIELHPIISKIDFEYVLNKFIDFFGKILSFDEINEMIDSIPISHLYDPNLEIIFHKNIVLQLILKLKNLILNHDNPEFPKIGIISAGLAEKNLVSIGFLLLVLLQT